MMHEMKLQPEYFNYILNGTKRIEIRLNDDKRKQIKVGDTIRFFKEPDLKDFFDTTVTDLLRYDSFDDMVKELGIEVLADKNMTKEELINSLEVFYTKEKQKELGVLCIKFELL